VVLVLHLVPRFAAAAGAAEAFHVLIARNVRRIGWQQCDTSAMTFEQANDPAD
jgi:hypothetical protein